MSHEELSPSPHTERPSQKTSGWRICALNVFLLAYLALQLTLPMRGCRHDAIETRGNFSWNMYSRVYTCNYDYEWVSRYGQVKPIDIRKYFNRSRGATKIMHADTLPMFHAWLCNKMRDEHPQDAVRAFVSVREDDRPSRTLVARGTWICSDPKVDGATP